MARSTKKSLAGKAASAARRVVRVRGASAGAGDSAKVTKAAAKKGPAKKAAAKKAAAKKAPAKKAAAKKATAKKAPAKKTAAKKAPAKKTPAKKAPAKKTAAKKPTAKKPAAKKPTAKKPAAKKPTARKGPAKKTPAKKAAAKKSPARKASKKAAPSALVVGKGESKWSKKELAEVLAELNEQRSHSLEIMAGQESELSAMLLDAGDGAGQDQADVGATSFERDHEITVLNTERDKLAQIDRALARIDDGTYGVCERCGNAIGKMRLMAFPRATLCMTCKQREERR